MFSLRSNVLPCGAKDRLTGFAMTEPRAKRNRKRGRGGRPKSDPAAVRSQTIGVRVNASEWDQLQVKASSMGMSPAQWLRHAALARMLPRRPAPELNRRAYADLARVGSNVNQLAKASNEGRIPEQSGELLRELLELLREIRLQLLGAVDDCEAD